MKTENILDSNLKRKSTIANDFFCKNWILKKFFTYMLPKKKKLQTYFFRKKIFTTPLSHVFKLI